MLFWVLQEAGTKKGLDTQDTTWEEHLLGEEEGRRRKSLRRHREASEEDANLTPGKEAGGGRMRKEEPADKGAVLR
jgi:hypothetical protein